MTAQLKSHIWSDFSERFVRRQALPDGSELRLYRKRNNRRVRSDISVKRKGVNSTTAPRLDDSTRVSALLNQVRELLSTDLEVRGFKLELYGPNDTYIEPNTSLKTVRQLEPVVKDKNKPFEVFTDALEESGVDDLSVRQAGLLYGTLSEIVGREELDKKLLIWAQKNRKPD